MSTEVEKIKVRCQCGRDIGYSCDGAQYLELGNVQVWQPTRFIHKPCGKPFIFQPVDPPDTFLTDEQRHRIDKELRNSLGKKRVVGRHPKVADVLEE
jgi:hypothetical protein